MNEKKIAIIANSLSLGGAERVSITLAEWWANKGIETYLITLNKDRKQGYELSSSVNRVPINDEGNLSKLKIINELRRKLRELSINKALVMGVPLSLYVIPASLGLNISVIISERNDPAHFKGKLLTKLLSRRLMYLAKGYVFQTEDAKKYYPKSIQKKSTIIPNPLLTDNLPQLYKGKREKVIVTAGRLVEQKNHVVLVKAFSEITKQFPDYRLVIYGNGPEKNNIEQLIKKLHLQDKVFLPGAVQDLFTKIKKDKLFVLSSDFEGLPNALIEAMALGLPCVSTDCPSGGPKSVIKNMKNGILVPVRDPYGMARAISFLLENKNVSQRISYEAIKVRNQLDKDYICNLWSKYLFETE